MKTLLRLEEVAQFALAIFLFSQLPYAWWVFPACILLPDISILAYIAGPKIGAMVYNFFHHKLVGIVLIILGYALIEPIIGLIGIILFGHSAMDRIFGFGLKYQDNFKNTHLGKMG